MRSRLWLVLLVIALLVPRTALAEEKIKTDEVDIESIENVEQLRAGPVTPLQLITSFFNNVRFQMYSTHRLNNLIPAIVRLMSDLLYRRLFIIPAVIMVFGWWGVRKVIRMLFRAFRRGKANV